MSSGSQTRNRSKRVASVELPPGLFLRTINYLRRGDVLVRLGICFLAALLMWLVTKGWQPPMTYRTWDFPARKIVARIDFERDDWDQTKITKDRAQERAKSQALNVYEHHQKPLENLRFTLKDQVFQVIRAESFADVDLSIWNNFLDRQEEQPAKRSETESIAAFKEFCEALVKDADLAEFEKAVERALLDFERNGLLEKLEHDRGSNKQIIVQPEGRDVECRVVDSQLFVYSVDGDEPLPLVEVEDVRIAEIGTGLLEELVAQLKSEVIGKYVYQWFEQQLKPTLAHNPTASDRVARHAAELAASEVETVKEKFLAGEALPQLAAGVPFTKDAIELLRLEHRAFVQQRTKSEIVYGSLASLGMYAAIYALCGFYIAHRKPRLLKDLRHFLTIVSLYVLLVSLSQIPILTEWRAEIVLLLMFGTIITIAYQQDLALVLTAGIALVVVLTTGRGLNEFVIYVASSATAIQMSAHIRSRTKLIYIGSCAGLVSFATTLGVSLVSGYPLGTTLLANAALYGFFCFLAGVLMTGLLPFVESLFDVQTEISLLELGDAAHPLLQELVRRAPGTYNHSINVASIAEAAADSIGANGLLVRVGAYFHDIGKMLKPGYFAENQGESGSQHKSLVPAMSTLVIIAHVKDGADLARQHHLPHSIVDFIEQHHGTSLVEYFFDQAKGKSKDDPNGEEVDESTFRYPGPKPQNKEAGVLMLADAVESASRTLVDPAPARIESLVEEIAMKRLLEGEFDDSGLTLSELHAIEASLAKSLTAVFHGRVKYPNQNTA